MFENNSSVNNSYQAANKLTDSMNKFNTNSQKSLLSDYNALGKMSIKCYGQGSVQRNDQSTSQERSTTKVKEFSKRLTAPTKSYQMKLYKNTQEIPNSPRVKAYESNSSSEIIYGKFLIYIQKFYR